MLHTDPAAYYTARAATYEENYARPERAAELTRLQNKLADLMAGHAVLEVGCGSGYWTRQLAQVCDPVLALDSNAAVLALAPSLEHVRFAQADAYQLPLSDQYSACFGAFWWSHVPKQNQAAWLSSVQRQVGKDSLLVLIDNSYVEGSSTPIARTDAHGNTYQIRNVDGERYEVMKNFPTDSTLRKRFAAHARDIRVLRLEHFWMLSCRLK